MKQAASLSRSSAFIQQVIDKQPRIAVFDCDGTLWSGDAGADFFYWEIERGLIAPHVAEWALIRYKDYKAGRVSELTMCGEMATIHDGLGVDVIRAAARMFYEDIVAQRIFPEMHELTHRLIETGCEVWAVSSTLNWVIEAGIERFGIPKDRVLAACVKCAQGKATNHLIRVPTDDSKASAIREVIARDVDAVFGNSMHDFAMLEIARHPYAIGPNAELERSAKERGWTIYWPQPIEGKDLR